MEKEVKAVKDHDKYGKSLVQLSRILMGVGIIISAVLIIVSVRDAHENLLYASSSPWSGASFFASFWKQRDTESF
ncbi:MAG: hypothetical protein II564_01960 [Oscillospiraceae bacterium]|nr:hypothetical protein [Oscillospiraceae bacterium]